MTRILITEQLLAVLKESADRVGRSRSRNKSKDGGRQIISRKREKGFEIR